MDTRERLKRMIYYLMDVKSTELEVQSNISVYRKGFWQKNLLMEGCILKIKKDGNKYLEINSKCKRMYDEFSKIYSKILKEHNKLEIIWGYCFSTLKLNNIRMSYPLFSYKCRLKFCHEEEKYILEPVDNRFKVEIDVLRYISFSNIEKNIKVKNFIETNLKSISREEDIKKALTILQDKLKVKTFKNKKIKSNSVTSKDIGITDEVTLYKEPIIVVQEFSKSMWNDELNDILNKVQQNHIPDTIKALVENTPFEDKSHLGFKDGIKEKLYALPCNKEQLSIGEEISHNFGVVVEGPPGTGKTYSVANLISHLLANGKKILITTANYKSRENILSMVPDEIKSLCINYNKNQMKNLYQINTCVCNLIEKIQLNSNIVENDIRHIEFQLKSCRANQSSLYNKLNISKNIKESKINYFGKTYTVEHIEKWLEKYKNQYSWIDDEINNMQRPPITDAKFSRLLYIMSNTTKEEIYEVNNVGGLLYNIPPYHKLLSKIKRKSELKRNYGKYKLSVKDWCISYNCHYDYEYILKTLRKTQRFLSAIENTWLQNIFDCVKRGEIVRNVLQQTILKCNYYIKKIGSIKKQIDGHNVEIPKDMELSTLLQILETISRQYDKKGKINRIFRIIHNECEEVMKRCLVDSKIIDNKNSITIVKLYVEQCIIEKNLLNLWNNSMKEYGADEIDKINSKVITNLEEYIGKIDIIINWSNKVIKKITISMREIVFLNKLHWYNKDTYEKLEKGVTSIRYISEYQDIKSYIGNIQKIMSKIKEFRKIVQALEEDDIVSLKQCYKKIDKLKDVMPGIMEMEYILESIEQYCPKLIDRLIEEEDRVNMLIKYKNFSMAWTWNQLNYRIKEEYNKFKSQNISKEITNELKKEKILVKRLCSNKCWYNSVLRITEKKKRSLYSYKDAINRLGKASGKNSNNYIKLAMEELDVFKDIIPVWIMPLDEIIKSFSLDEELFDVLIIDEASNMNIFAISAMFRAKKAIIFGDEKQSNIENTIHHSRRIKLLEQKYLMDIPNWQWFDMKTSIYSTVIRTFPSIVKLSTNYRNLPEIINFSNELCYLNKIVTANKNNKINELWMPIKAIKVQGIRDTSRAINMNEAKAIVTQIEECCKNPIYNGMTMGVISLLGDEQSELIDHLLRDSIEQKEIEDRKITCGTSYMFEGEERDVIFLSMVISNDVKFATLTKDRDIKRFNVAASRAKKQMWLFHSIDLQDLNEECVRAKLLNYCINVKVINKNLRIA